MAGVNPPAPSAPGQDRALERALDAAERGEARARLLTELSASWYWEQDADLRFIEISGRAESRAGVPAVDPLGKRRWELPMNEPVNTTWAEHQAMLVARQPFHDLIVRRSGIGGAVRYTKTSGLPRFDRSGVFLGYHGIGSDITEEYHAAVALRESEARNRVLAEMVEQSTDAIFARDLDGLVTYWNAGAERLYGYSASEALGQPMRALQLAELSAAELTAALARLRSGVRETLEAQRTSKDGRPLDVVVNTAPLYDAQGLHVGAVYVVRDITALRSAAREMQRAREAAEAANRAKSEFLANMSHEVRTPLNGILGMTRLVLDGPLETEQRQLLSLVVASGNALAGVINDILDFSKIEAGKLDIERIEFHPHDLVPDIVRTLQLRAQEKGLALRCQVAPDTPPTVLGDPGRLRQVLLNLVGNALKFTERGEIEVTLEVAERDAGSVLLEVAVRDTGIGIPAHQQQQIFDAFSQGDSGTTRRYGGTGLGLTISARLVDLMGGRIGVRSDPGHGSRFHFTLRCGLPRVEPVEPPVPEADQLRGMDVLVVEDNATYREVLLRILGSWGMAPQAAADGETGLALLEQARRQGRPFPLVILDLALPGLDGFAVAGAVRQQAPETPAAVMMLTANGQRGDAARCRELGIRAYLSKPVRPSELFNGIVTALAPNPITGVGTLVTRHSLRERKSGAAILLVEDNEVNRVLAMTILARLGHQVTVAEDGAEAVERCAQGKFDLVLMDMQMPGMDGLQATACIRTLDSPMRRVPVIALTANALQGDRERCLAAGMDDYLTKPFNAEQLAAMIDQWLPGRASGWAVTAAAAVERVDSPGEVLDAGALEQLCKAGGDDGAAFVERIIGVFIAEAGRQLEALRSGLAAADARAVRRAAHTLKSSSAAVGAVALNQLCRSIEFGAAAGALDAVSLLRVEQAITRTEAALRAARAGLV